MASPASAPPEHRRQKTQQHDRGTWLRARPRPRPRTFGPRHEGLVDRRLTPRDANGFPGTFVNQALPKRVLAREQRYRYSLIGADVLAGALALVLSLSVFGDDRVGLLTLAVVLPVLVLLSKLHGLYDRDDLLLRKTTIEEIPRLFQHATLATLALVVCDGQLGVGAIGDAQALALCGLILGFSTSARMLARRLARTISATERVLILGDVGEERQLRERGAGYLDVEFLGPVAIESISSQRELRELVVAQDVDRVVICPADTFSPIATAELVRGAKAAGVRVSVLPGVLDVVGTQVEFDDVFGLTLLGVRSFGLTRSSRAIKRAFDLVLGGTLIVLVSPLVLVAGLLVRLETRGPAFYLQERIGFRGRRFRMVKIRTMVDDADERKAELAHLNEGGEGLFKIADDPRVTRMGKILRKTHLDELPQLINVVRGQMSLVGPRPLVGDEDQRIKGLDRRRLELTPGMTGPWQILGTRRRVPMAEMVKLDYLYAADWSLWNDVKIIVRTAAQVARRSGV